MAATAYDSPPFHGFKAGDLVLVQQLPEVNGGPTPEWWMGWIVWVDGGARNPSVPTMFQVADCDTGDVRWINADEATRLVLSGLEGMSIQADCLVCDR
jgi:hypothetical protein